MAAAVLLVAHHVVVRRVRLHVVDSRHGLGCVTECGVMSNIIYAVAADIDDASIA